MLDKLVYKVEMSTPHLEDRLSHTLDLMRSITSGIECGDSTYVTLGRAAKALPEDPEPSWNGDVTPSSETRPHLYSIVFLFRINCFGLKILAWDTTFMSNEIFNCTSLSDHILHVHTGQELGIVQRYLLFNFLR